MLATPYLHRYGLDHCIAVCYGDDAYSDVDISQLYSVVRYHQARQATGYDVVERLFVRQGEVLQGVEWVKDTTHRAHVESPLILAHDKHNIYKRDGLKDYRWLNNKWVEIQYTLGRGVTSIFNTARDERPLFSQDSFRNWRYN